MTQPRLCYFVQQDVVDTNGEYVVCIAKEGTTGYFLTDWHWGTDFDHAEALAERQNEKLGISKEDALKIIISTMRKGGRWAQSKHSGKM